MRPQHHALRLLPPLLVLGLSATTPAHAVEAIGQGRVRVYISATKFDVCYVGILPSTVPQPLAQWMLTIVGTRGPVAFVESPPVASGWSVSGCVVVDKAGQAQGGFTVAFGYGGGPNPVVVLAGQNAVWGPSPIGHGQSWGYEINPPPT